VERRRQDHEAVAGPGRQDLTPARAANHPAPYRPAPLGERAPASPRRPSPRPGRFAARSPSLPPEECRHAR
jgi:hypothetical protein